MILILRFYSLDLYVIPTVAAHFYFPIYDLFFKALSKELKIGNGSSPNNYSRTVPYATCFIIPTTNQGRNTSVANYNLGF